MDGLPAEVYYDIFDYLSSSEVKICSHVCKRLNELAIRVISKTLIINDRKLQTVKHNLANGYIDIYFTKGKYVKSLKIKSKRVPKYNDYSAFPNQNNDLKARLTQTEFLLLMKYLPNIEEVNFTESIYHMYYLSYLSGIDLQYIKKITPIPYKFCTSSNRDHLPSLRFYSWSDISPHNADTFPYFEHNKYLSTCLKFCGTLTRLCLCYTKDTKDFDFCGIGILDTLSQFKNLKQLEFNNSYSDNSIMFRIQEFCPQLTELTFTSEISHEFVQPTAKPNKYLQHLNIILKSLPADYTRYLTSYIEDGSKSISIQIRHTGFYDWIEEVGMKNALNFMEKLGQSNNASITFSENPNNRQRNLRRTMKWLQVASAFKGNKKVLFSVNFCSLRSLPDYFKYCSSNKGLTLIIGQEEANDLLKEDDSISCYDEYLSELPLPTPFVPNILFGIINHLDFDLDVMYEYRALKLLEYALAHCINLHYFKAGEYLKLQGCANQKNSKLDSILNNSKMVYFICSKPNYDMLNAISSHLRNIEILVFANYTNDCVVWNLTRFKNLKRCYFLVENISVYYVSPFLFKFEYTDGKEQSYYHQKGGLVRKSKGFFRTSSTLICKKDMDFTLCFELTKGLWGFDIDKLQENRYLVSMLPL